MTIPVYLFVGMLESGKTSFIQETMEDPKFDSGEKTLLLLCEEGEEELEPEKFASAGSVVVTLDSKEQLTTENLVRWQQETGAERVLIEYNGMWLMEELAAVLPPDWTIYQCIMTADGTTLENYLSNMRQLLLDKFAVSELLVVNRAEKVTDRMEIHKAVRQASRRCDIAYEYADGSVEYDDIPDELPFDVSGQQITLEDDQFGIWYLDASENPAKYKGKTISFKAQVCQTDRAGKGCFVPGRFAMTCCVDDITFVGFVCKYDQYKTLEQRSWIWVKAKINLKYHPLYRGEGSVLTALEISPAEAPAEDVVYFS